MTAAHISPYAGTWYPERASELERLLDDCFHRSAPRASIIPGAYAFVVPHAAPEWSGTVAAAVYRSIEQQRPERVLILAFPHRGGLHGVAAPDVSSIQTPLGRVLLHPMDFPRLPERRLCDHSLEIQIPFLQKAAPEAEVTALYVGPMDTEERRRTSDRLAALWRPGTVFLASSDFNHYGPGFGYVPFPDDDKIGDRLRELDFDCIQAAGSIHPGLFLEMIAARRATVCGVDPIALLLDTLSRMSPGRAFQSVLDYQTSGEIANDFRNSVSYAALGYYPPGAFELGREDREALLDSAEGTLDRLRATGARSPLPARGSGALNSRRGVFVSLHRGDELLGCIGNVFGRDRLATDVADLTLAAALDDPRFEPAARFGGAIDLEISVLTPLRRLVDPMQLCCGRHGALLEVGRRTALLLPQVATGSDWDTARFLAALSRKALAGANAWRAPGARLSVFEAQVFSRPGRPGRF